MQGPREAAKILYRYISISDPPRGIDAVLIHIITEQQWAGGKDPAEIAELWTKKFKLYVQGYITEAREDGRFVQFCFNSASDDFVQGACFIEPFDDEKVRRAKASRANLAKYTGAFEKLTPSEFEMLCGRVLTLFNVEQPIVTRASADQGIDFFGQVPFGTMIKPSVIPAGAEKQLKIWLVGQAKHYNATQVGTKDIRELVGSVSLAKSKAYAGAKDPLSELLIRSCDPVFYLFFTTGNISKDARELLKKAGVIAMDGIQLAVFLADHGVGCIDGEFNHISFVVWID